MQSLNKQDPDQDPRENSGMEDSTKMTIEFLRARLLCERSVSRTAKQRADELAKRVVELEEQLKIVSLQRKKAEKAATDVLAILENNGISEFSEEFDSSSDQEVIHSESKVGNNSQEEEGSSVGSKMRRNRADELSGSEIESSPLPGRSLSWKSGKGSSHCCGKKYLDSPTRRRSGSASTTSASPRRRIGKSCRQVRRRETRSAVEESQSDNNMLAPQENGVATFSEDFPTHSDNGPEILRDSSERDANIFLAGSVLGDLENQRMVANAGNYLDGHGSEKEMERALEHQAQLIGQYQEEEKAQREWEEKFRENSSTPDSCEPGNHSDITEERDEPKACAPYRVGAMASEDQEAKSKVEDVCASKESSRSQSNGFQSPPHVELGCFQDQKSQTSQIEFPVATGKQDQQFPGNNAVLPPHGYEADSYVEVPTGNQPVDIVSSHEGCSLGCKNQQHLGNYGVPALHSYHHCSYLEVSTGNQSACIIPSHQGSTLCKGDASGRKNEHYPLIPSETPEKLGSVPQYSGNYSVLAPQSYHHHLYAELPTGSQSAYIVPSHKDSSLCKADTSDTSGTKNEQYALITHETPAKLGSVLEALHQAKLSLKHKVNALPPAYSASVGKAIEFSVGDRHEVPVGCAGLFRVPSDFHSEATSKANFPGSNSQLSLTSYYPDAGNTLTAVDRIASPFTDSSSTISAGNRNLSTQTSLHMESHPFAEPSSSVSTGNRNLAIPTNLYMESSPFTESSSSVSTGNRNPAIPTSLYNAKGSRIPTREPLETRSRFSFRNPNMDAALVSSSAYASPAYPYSDLMPRMPSDDGRRLFSSTGAGIHQSDRFWDLMPRMPSDEGRRLFSSTGAGIHQSDRFSFYDDNIRPNIFTSTYASPAHAYADLMPRMPSDDGRRLFSSSGAGIPPPNRFTFYDDKIRPDMYR